ncbi:sigma-70 family RNA polymerase sigma factor [Ferrimonas gelatinilytica]|uniref:Sigma-70 family RNA polymerase sigma factor n=1 Tax=Ferrimonas gelatinilytica TaxID=1255257 RepID=A0ABP9S1Q8_9GAMM
MTTSAEAGTEQHQHWLTAVAERRDRRAFAELFRYYAPRLLSHARKHFQNDAFAEEMVQETMTKVWLKAHLYQNHKGKVSTWLFTIARNVRFDMLRRMQARPEQLCAEEIYLDYESESDVELDHALVDQPILRQQLLTYCERLPEGQRIVLKMIYFDDFSQQEVADALSIPLGTVKSRLRLALAKIRELLDDHH